MQSIWAWGGDFTLGEDSLALAKSSGSAFYVPNISGDKLKGDLQEALLSKKMTISDWSHMCSQVKLLEPTVSWIKTVLTGQEFDSIAINEITNITGVKPLKFPLKFDCPTTWSTLETLGNARQNEQYDIVSSAVSKAL